MRIYIQESDRTFDDVVLILSEAELGELRDAAAALVRDPNLGHIHVLSEDYTQKAQHQITLTAIEGGQALGGFAPRIARVIQEDR